MPATKLCLNVYSEILINLIEQKCPNCTGHKLLEIYKKFKKTNGIGTKGSIVMPLQAKSNS